MNIPPTHIGRTPDAIIKEHAYFDSAGYFYRSVSWLDLFSRERHAPALMYACIEGRYGIEYLLFEELVIATGAHLQRQDYEKCVREPTKLAKTIDRLIPDYEKLQDFTDAVVSVNSGAPPIIRWKPRQLMKSWGELSQYLHWLGHRLETVESEEWKNSTLLVVEEIIKPIWANLCAGYSAYLIPDQMHPEVREIWIDFKSGKIDIESAKIRMDLMNNPAASGGVSNPRA